MSAHAIIESIKKGALAEVKESIENDKELANASSPEGLTLLMLAAYCGHLEIAALLGRYKNELSIYEAVTLGNHQLVTQYLNQDYNLLNRYSGDGFTLLGLACFFGQEALAQRLIAEGAEVNKASDNGMKVAPIHSAVARKSLPITALLIANGANVNLAQQKGITPLHSAAHSGSSELARLLVEHGADSSLETDGGKTALDYARESGHKEVVDLLV